jgi:uncharacterized protein (TIGR00255 family)
MLLSMTGFGNDVYSNDKYTLETEIKSLNSRYLDLSVRIPKELSQHEFAIRDLVKNKLIRGKITVSINLSFNSSCNDDIALNESELLKTVNLLNRIKTATNSEENLSISQLLLFRENFLDEADSEIDFEVNLVLQSLSKALDNLVEMRAQEGAQLKIDLEARIKIIDETLAKIENLAQNSTKEYFEKFREKAKKLSDEFVDDKDRFLIELGILSEKHDVTEECIRLHSHIKLFNDSLLKSQDVGRKLNFICQEMNREVNTINSKSISSEVSHLGINIKEELEKIREQVQNIE